MSGSVNSVVLVGRLTRDPELQKTVGGWPTVWFTVACDRPKRKDQEEQQTDFISCRAWRQQAEFLSQYGAKGSLVSIQGNIQTGSYQDKEGRTVYTTTVVADRIQLLESKSSGQRNDYPSNGTSYTRDDISRDLAEGFNTGPDAGITNEDLPF